MRCKMLALIFVAMALAPSPVRAQTLDMLCPGYNSDCRSFVGLYVNARAAKPPAPGGKRYGHAVSGRVVAMTRHDAWRAMRCLAYVGWAEGRGEGPEAMHAVMWAVLNRFASNRFENTICGVIARPAAFEPMARPSARPWLEAMRNGTMPPDIKPETHPDMLAALTAKAIAWHLLHEPGQDPTGGATDFLAPETQIRLGRPMPAWTQIYEHTVTIGGHAFYRRDKLQTASAD